LNVLAAKKTVVLIANR